MSFSKGFLCWGVEEEAMTVLFECGGLTVAMSLNIEIKETITRKVFGATSKSKGASRLKWCILHRFNST